MKRMMILLGMMLASCAAMAATWTDPKTGIEWTYTVSNGKASVGGGSWNSPAISTSTTGAITIPSTLGGYPVTSIGYGAFHDCSGLTSVTIPSSVTSIGERAFSGCSGLTSVTIPSSVTSIGKWAFYDCNAICDVTVPGWKCGINFSSVTNLVIAEETASIGNSAFGGCIALTSVTIPSSVTSIGKWAFSFCSGLTSVTIPDGVTSIGNGAFECCSGLMSFDVDAGNPNYKSVNGLLLSKGGEVLIFGVNGSVTIPSGVTSIGSRAFSHCTGLTSVTISSSVTNIGECAFAWCSGLTSVTIPSSVTSIGECAFSGCSGLVSFDVDAGNPNYKSVNGLLLSKDGEVLIFGVNGSVTIPSGVTSIGECAFYDCSGLTSVTIPSSVTSIGDMAFCDCSGLTSVTIPSSVTNIGGGAFEGCSGLTSVTIPEGVTSIGDYAFCDCSGLTSVTIPSSVTSIGGGAFDCCRGLTSVTIPEGVTSIGDYAFCECTGLTSVTIPSSVTSIGGGAFAACDTLNAVDFEGTPPEGVANADIKTDAAIRYNVAYEEEWLPVIAEYGWTNASPYLPAWSGRVSFVAPNGEVSVLSHVYTNETYGVLPEARREGFTFAGWYTSLDGAERVSAFSSVLPGINVLYARWVEDDASLYAQWEANKYSVNFNANGGEGEMAAQPFLYDQVQALNGNAFTKLGYTFKGWATAPDGEVVYTNGVSVSNLTAEAGFAVALFAKWEKAIDVATDTIEDWVIYDLAPKFKKQGESGSAYRKRFEAEYGDDYAVAFFTETGKIGMDGTKLQVWHDYVAGTDPLDKNSQFTATITFDDKGVPKVEYNPKFSDATEAAKRIYTTYGKKNLADKDWSVVDGHEADYNFFKVTVEMK